MEKVKALPFNNQLLNKQPTHTGQDFGHSHSLTQSDASFSNFAVNQ